MDFKRSSERQSVSLVVDYDGPGELCRDYTQNLSSGGAFVHTERTLKVGDQVDLQLSFPGLLQPLQLHGVVRWVRPVSPLQNGVGIEFLKFDDDARERMDSLLERIAQRDPELVERPLRVLLVEDNPHVAMLIRTGLKAGKGEDQRIEFEGANNGGDAVTLLAENSYDLLVIDVNLPILDGPSVIRKVRESEQGKDKELPIIAVSAGGRSAGEEALAAGANFFLEKPMQLRQIVQTMQRLLGTADED